MSLNSNASIASEAPTNGMANGQDGTIKVMYPQNNITMMRMKLMST